MYSHFYEGVPPDAFHSVFILKAIPVIFSAKEMYSKQPKCSYPIRIKLLFMCIIKKQVCVCDYFVHSHIHSRFLGFVAASKK